MIKITQTIKKFNDSKCRYNSFEHEIELNVDTSEYTGYVSGYFVIVGCGDDELFAEHDAEKMLIDFKNEVLKLL